MSKAEKTRQHIIEQTAPIFNKKGFAGTTLSDLTESTGLTKGALYGHFQNKEEMAAEAFQYAIKKFRELVRMKVNPFKTSRDQLLALLEFFSDYVFQPPVEGGCPLLNSAVEVDDDRPTMRGVVVKEMMETVTFIERLIIQGIAKGEFHSEAQPRALGYTFFCVIEGAIMFSRAEQSREPMDIVIAHCKKLLDQISIKTNEQTT